MPDQSGSHEIWNKILSVISVNIRVFITLGLWVALFIGIMTGFYPIPLLIVVAILSILNLYGQFNHHQRY